MSADTPTGPDDAVRPLLAVALAFVMPGAGHLYLRAWVRALLWFGLFYTSFLLVVPTEAQQVELSIDGLTTAVTAMPLEAQLALLSVTAFNMADAYWLAVRTNDRAGADGAPTCPNCGKELDEDIDFCHWCTTRLDEAAVEDDGAV